MGPLGNRTTGASRNIGHVWRAIEIRCIVDIPDDFTRKLTQKTELCAPDLLNALVKLGLDSRYVTAHACTAVALRVVFAECVWLFFGVKVRPGGRRGWGAGGGCVSVQTEAC